MTKELWWKTGVIYQIYPRSFNDTTGNGIGDLNGIMEKLDYLNDGTESSLGIDAIWLSPVYPSPHVDFGYDVENYTDIDPIYGNLQLFKTFLAEIHRREIRLIMDLVLNHTSDQHPWFKKSRTDKTNPKRDWYIWRPGKKGKPPSNWASYFGGSAWKWDDVTEEYYLAMFDPSQPDLNWRNPDVKEALFNVMRFWLDLGVDGFRLDVYNQYFKDDRFRSNPKKLNFRGLIHRFEGQRHIYDRDRPELKPVLAEMRRLTDAYPERVLLGETSSEKESKIALEYYGADDDGLHLAFDFAFLKSKWDASEFRREIKKWEAELPDWAWPTYVLSNHDVIRHFSRYDKSGKGYQRAKVAAAMLLTLRGVPTLYYGEELGQADLKLSRSQIMDPPGKRFWPLYKGRDGCRGPMQWDSTANAGFTAGSPWLPVNPDYSRKNALDQIKDPNSLLSFYRHLIWLRKKHSALRTGALELIDEDDPGILAFRRTHGSDRIIVLLNFSSQRRRFNLKSKGQTTVLLSTARKPDSIIAAGDIDLNVNEVLILQDTNE